MEYNIVVIGAGPAGLRAAETLAQNGKNVLVLEKSKELGCKVCASGLTLKDIHSFKIPKKIVERSFNSVNVYFNKTKRVLAAKKPYVFTTRRKKLALWLASKTEKAGAEIRLNSELSKIKKNSLFVNGQEIKFDYLVGADGSNSIVRNYLKLPSKRIVIAMQYIAKKQVKTMEFYFNIDSFGVGYTWVFPYKNYVSIGVSAELAFDAPKIFQKNFESWHLDWCRKNNCEKGEFQSSIINFDYKGYEFGNIFLVGDAGGFASGLTGEGMYYAMMSGEEVAKKICDKNYNCPKIKEILETKKRDNFLVKLMCLNRQLTKVEFKILAFLLRWRFFNDKLINAFSYK